MPAVATSLTVGVWKHLTFVHDGTKDRIYVNGVKVAEKNVSGTLNSTTRPLGIGFDAVDRGNFFHGAIDEVAAFDVALNDIQIAAAYAPAKRSTHGSSGYGSVLQFLR
jgi:hypothetical protein